MKFTRASSYAIHALVFLAAKRKNRPMASQKIAQARDIPERFLLKVLKLLVSARILHSLKGPNGGYRLARAASEITILDVVEAVDGPICCQPTAPTVGDLDKHLNEICSQAAEQIRKQFQKVRISELAGKD
jgi:Rrf2 family protein